MSKKMSQTLINENNNNVTKEELKRILANNGKAVATWFNPEDGVIYQGETVDAKGKVTPTYEDPIFDTHKYKIAEGKSKSGDLDATEAALSPWIGRWKDVANERYQFLEAKAKGHAGVADAGVMTNAQYAAMDTTTVHNRLFNTELREFSIPESILQIPTNGLELQVDVYSRFNISLNVPEGVAAWAKSPGLTTVSYDLVKDVGHIAATDEALMKNRQNLWATAITNVTTDFRRAMTVKIAAILATFTETNVGDWDAFTSGLSDANPIEHIGLRMDAIVANNGNPTVIVSSAKVWRAFVGNTNVRGAFNNQREGISSDARGVTNALFPGVTWYIDNEMTPADSMIIMDRDAVAMVVGPSRVGQYRLEVEGIDGYVARRWYQAQVLQSGKGAELVTVTT